MQKGGCQSGQVLATLYIAQQDILRSAQSLSPLIERDLVPALNIQSLEYCAPASSPCCPSEKQDTDQNVGLGATSIALQGETAGLEGAFSDQTGRYVQCRGRAADSTEFPPRCTVSRQRQQLTCCRAPPFHCHCSQLHTILASFRLDGCVAFVDQAQILMHTNFEYRTIFRHIYIQSIGHLSSSTHKECMRDVHLVKARTVPGSPKVVLLSMLSHCYCLDRQAFIWPKLSTS